MHYLLAFGCGGIKRVIHAHIRARVKLPPKQSRLKHPVLLRGGEKRKKKEKKKKRKRKTGVECEDARYIGVCGHTGQDAGACSFFVCVQNFQRNSGVFSTPPFREILEQKLNLFFIFLFLFFYIFLNFPVY